MSRLAGVSAALGIGAVVVAVGPLADGPFGTHVIVTSIGVSAVITGVRAALRNRSIGSILASALATIGIGTGILGTVVMLATMGAFNSLEHSAAAVPQQNIVPRATVIASTPTPELPASATTIGTMEQTIGTLAYTMKHAHTAGTAWPAALDVSITGLVSMPGSVQSLVQLPAGTVLGYRTSTDGTAFAVRLSMTADPAKYVDYDTNSGLVTASVNR